MSIRDTMKKSLSLFKAHQGDLLRAQGMVFCIWGICLCPLLFLLTAQTKWLALLCPVMLLLLALPTRQSTASAMQAFLSGMPMATVGMLPMKHYGRHLRHALYMVGLMLLWFLPFLAALSVPFIMNDSMDVVSLYLTIESLGGGSVERAIVGYAVLLCVLLLLPLLGVVFHSATRHAYALGDRGLLRHRRGKLMALRLSGLAFVAPSFLYLVWLLVSTVMNAVNFVLKIFNDLSHFPSVSLLIPPTWQLVVAVLAVLLMLLVNPIRFLMPAIYLREIKDQEGKNHATA